MPLQSTNMYAGGPIKAADIIQFFNLFTGVMTDQPVTLANTLTVGGSQSDASVPLRVSSQATGTARVFEVRTLQADANPVFGVSRLGVLSFGAGGGTATDTTITRSAVNQLTFSGGAIITTGGLQVTAGNVGIGPAPSAGIGLNMTGPLTTGATQLGVNVAPTFANASSSANGMNVTITTVASFTSPFLASIRAQSPAFGATQSITNVYGIYVDPLVAVAGVTNAYGLLVNKPTSASAVNLGAYIDGGLDVVSGNIGLGILPVGNIGIYFGSGLSLSGNVQQWGIDLSFTANSAATSNVAGIISRPSTAPGAYTLGSYADFYAGTGGKGSGMAITSAYGLFVDPITLGNTNNYGIYVSAPSSGSTLNIGAFIGGGIVISASPSPVAGTVSLTGVVNALGGGATPTFGTIGGSGPTSAAQQSWWRINDGTASRWVPIWG